MKKLGIISVSAVMLLSLGAPAMAHASSNQQDNGHVFYHATHKADKKPLLPKKHHMKRNHRHARHSHKYGRRARKHLRRNRKRVARKRRMKVYHWHIVMPKKGSFFAYPIDKYGNYFGKKFNNDDEKYGYDMCIRLESGKWGKKYNNEISKTAPITKKYVQHAVDMTLHFNGGYDDAKRVAKDLKHSNRKAAEDVLQGDQNTDDVDWGDYE